ncbi:hypothetical protein [Polaribacter sp. Asnod1-A03]|uniref:hypothetical protein n=1 Tax=Polaribacter sp. Asnod1-A03 TaxID=3160581 RepID=UPI0038706B04
MEENKDIKKLDAFAKKYVKEIKQEQPSLDFTSFIIQTITKESTSKVLKPSILISKKMWTVLTVLFVACLAFILKNKKENSIQFPEFNFSFLTKIKMPNLFENVVISNSLFLVIAIFTFMIFVQIIFLKNHFNKRLE